MCIITAWGTGEMVDIFYEYNHYNIIIVAILSSQE